jgi:hypothetical protein
MLRFRLVECFHQTSGLLFHLLFFPVGLACCHEDVGMKFLDQAIERSEGLDFDFGWELQGAVGTVFQAIGVILFGIYLGEDVLGGAGGVCAAEGKQRAQHGCGRLWNRTI